MKKILVIGALTMTAAYCLAAESVSDAAIAQKFHPSLVRVEYTLQSDKADNPEISGWGERCPNCGEIHSIGDGSEFILQERPLEITGFVLAADKILTPDLMIHPRFVSKIEVRHQNTVVSAKPIAYTLDHAAVILQLEKNISDIRPIDFSKSDKKPFKAVTYSEQNGLWTMNIAKMSNTYTLRDNGESFLAGPSGSLIVDTTGTAVGVCMTGFLPLDDSWQTSPLNWPAESSQAMQTKLADFRRTSANGLLRVKLDFRSPKKTENMYSYHSYSDQDENATEMNVVGVIIDPTHVLILANLKPKTTARLEQITLFPESVDPIKASFEGTLKDYGALTATLEKPINNAAVPLNSNPITDFERKTLFSAEVRIQGENKTIYAGHSRIGSFATGWRQQLQPVLPLYTENRYLFDMDGKLLAFPMSRRKKIQNEEDRWMMDDFNLIAACYLKPTLLAIHDNIDENNTPLSEEKENRIAWLGVEMQSLNEELARINKVSNLSKDGEIGAIVSYVYPNSPASVAELEIGDILLRFHIENHPQPLDVCLDNGYDSYMEMFPWERLDELPEEYYDQLPTPWPSVENQLIRTLTDVGFGTHYNAEIFHDGKVIQKSFTITQSPPHYDSAKQYKSESLGLTVRNMTYEVNRYFRLKSEDPGVIVSKLLPGSKASVSGIKPYEIITHVDNAPVRDVSELEKLIASGNELKLSVKRMTKGRIVNIRTDAKPATPTDEKANLKRKDDSINPTIEGK